MSGPLISVEELHDVLDVVHLLDVRYRMGGPAGHEEYLAGHVPGAVYVDLDTDLADPPGSGGRHPLPDPGRFVAAMRRLGVTGTRPVVVYDDWAGHAAARAWWLLEHYGHPDVRVLDGGWAAWRSAGRAEERGQVTPEPGDFDGRPGHRPVVEAAAVPGVDVLIDARASERFRGATEPIDPVAGRIPGAVNGPTVDNLDHQGRFRVPAELRARYAALGVTAGAEVAAYCGSGVTACHDVLAMDIAGLRAALYPGSWSGWITDPDRPVARG